MSRIHRALLFAILGHPLLTPTVNAATVDFGTVPTNLPYIQSGMVFTNQGPSLAVISGAGSDMALVAGTNVDPVNVRAQLVAPGTFSLTSIDIEQFFRTWTIQSSSGASVTVSSTGTIDFTGLSGWQGISSFNVIHSPAEANGSIQLDNVVFGPVPEPATVILILIGGAIYLARMSVDFLGRHRITWANANS